ncbi:unnamed protein product [Somion occarium]
MDLFTTNLFHFISSRFMLSPSSVFEPRDSAVVIVGGQHELGRTIALHLSELGYTIFSLSSSHQHPTSDHGPQSSSLSTANLVYEWHKKKERSPSMPWGVIAPIVLDTQSGPERYRAAETVQAYCMNNSLHLSAVVFLATDDLSVSLNDDTCQTISPYASKSPWNSNRAQASIWADAAAQTFKDPIIITQDYVEMLAEAAGRVILVVPSILSGLSPYQETSPVVTSYLRRHLAPFGVRISSLVADRREPPENNATPAPRRSQAKTSPSYSYSEEHTLSPYLIRRLGMRVYKAIRKCAVSQELIAGSLERIISSRYPKHHYAIGMYSRLCAVHDGILDIMDLFIQLLAPTDE